INLLPPGGELGIEMLFLAFFLRVADLGHCLTVGLYDLVVVIVDPDATLKITLLADDLFGRDIENETVQLVFLLLADIEDVVFGNFVGRQDKGQAVAKVLDVALIERKPTLIERRLRRKDDVFDALAFIVVKDVEDLSIFAGNGLSIESHDVDILAI